MKSMKIIQALLLICCAPGLFAQNEIVVNTIPQGAGVYYGGHRLGTTPLKITPDTGNAPGFFGSGSPAFEMIIAMEFYETRTLTFSFTKGNSTYNIPLNKQPRLLMYDGELTAEKKLKIGEIIMLSLEDLAKLREEVYARYGRPIKDKRFVEFFHDMAWYRENPLYSDSMLNYYDNKNLSLIDDFLVVNDADVELFRTVTRQYEYTTADKKYSIRFINARECVIDSGERMALYSRGIVPYFIEPGDTYRYFVAGRKVYMAAENGVHEIQLDLKNNRLIKVDYFDDIRTFRWWNSRRHR